MGTRKILFKNGIANILQKLVRVVDQLILVPFFISTWGVEYYGEWITLTIIPSILAFSDLGFGSAASSSIVLLFTSGKRQEAANMFKSSFATISGVVIVGLVLSVSVVTGLKYFNVFTATVINSTQAYWAILFMMASKLLNFYAQIGDSLYRACRRASLSVNLQNIYSFTNIIVGISVLLAGGNIVEFALANLIVSLIFNPLFIIIGLRISKWEEMSKARILKADVFETFNKGLGYMLSPIWQAIFFQGTTFVVRIVLGPAAVAVFNTVRTLSRSVNQMYSVVNGTVFPELQFQVGQGNMDRARKLYVYSIVSSFILALLGMAFLAVFGLWLYNLWTKNMISPSPAMWYIFIIGIGFNSLWWTAGVVFRAFNKPYELNIAGIVISLFSVAATFILSKLYGITGAALGCLLLELCMALYIMPKSLRFMGMSIASLTDSLRDIIRTFKKKLTT